MYRAQICCGTLRDPREGLMMEFIKNSLHQISIFRNFINQRHFFIKSAQYFFCFLFYNVHKENMFTIKIEDGREEPLKHSINILFYELMFIYVYSLYKYITS